MEGDKEMKDFFTVTVLPNKGAHVATKRKLQERRIIR